MECDDTLAMKEEEGETQLYKKTDELAYTLKLFITPPRLHPVL